MSKLSLIALTLLAAALFAGSCTAKPGLRFADAPAASAPAAFVTKAR